MSANVCILTTVHPRSDTRIFVKEATALAADGTSEVLMLVQDGLGSVRDSAHDVNVVDVGWPPRNRLARMTLGPWRMWRAVRTAAPDVAHFHDPELIPVGLALKLSGVRVIYDVHEDVPRQILDKYWIPVRLRQPIAWAVGTLEWVAARFFDAIVPATPKIAERFPACKTVVVQNFPLLTEFATPNPLPYADRPPAFAYVGGVTVYRGAREMIQAVGLVPETSKCRVELAGGFAPADLQDELEQLFGWARVRFHGWASRSDVAKILGGVRGGLVVLHPIRNHLDAYPVKMFEYMAAGLPVIASDFPLWRKIIEGAGCGLLVNPRDPKAIADAMQWILSNPDQAKTMGERGRRAVEETYNWDHEAKKLIRLYETLLPNDHRVSQQ